MPFSIQTRLSSHSRSSALVGLLFDRSCMISQQYFTVTMPIMQLAYRPEDIATSYQSEIAKLSHQTLIFITNPLRLIPLIFSLQRLEGLYENQNDWLLSYSDSSNEGRPSTLCQFVVVEAQAYICKRATLLRRRHPFTFTFLQSSASLLLIATCHSHALHTCIHL